MKTRVSAEQPTARMRAISALRAAGPEGMSKRELRDAVGGNTGAFRRLLMSMEDREEVTIIEEHRPNCGPTKVHTLGPAAMDVAASS